MIAALLAAVPASALAQPSAADRDTARDLMKHGDERFAAKDFAAALKAYQSAHAIMQVPTTGLAVARALKERGQLVEARDMLLQLARLPKDPNETAALAKAREEAAALAQSLADRIPSIVITIEGASDGVEVQVDGEVVPAAALGAPRKVNPGSHVITASSGGHVLASRPLSSKEGAHDQVALKLPPGRVPPSPKGVEGGGATHVAGPAEPGGASDPSSLEAAARPRSGIHIGVSGGPSTAQYFNGGGAFYGGTASFVLAIGGTPRFDFRTGAMVTFLYRGLGGEIGEQLMLGVPVMLKVNYSSWLSSAAGAAGGFATDFHAVGYSVGPEWSVLTLSAGEKRQYELSFSEGLRFGTLGQDFHQAVTFTYLFLD